METKQKDIFRRLKAYSHGYYAYATEDEKKAYDAKIEALRQGYSPMWNMHLKS